MTNASTAKNLALTFAELDCVCGGTTKLVSKGRMEAQLNSGGVNPIVISRDRALGN